MMKTKETEVEWVGKIINNGFAVILDEEKPFIAQEIQGRFMELIVDGLGNFKFIFKENIPDNESQCKYIVEAFWNPPNCEIVDFIVACYIDDIDSYMEDIKNNMIYYIEGARISCKYHIENGSDNKGVYKDISDSWFPNKESYVTPEMELLRQKELAEIEEAEHFMKCPTCGSTACNIAPNGAGILEECSFHCVCGWEEGENEVKDWDYKTLKLDETIDPMVLDIISRCNYEGMNTRDIAECIEGTMDEEMIEKFRKLIEMTIDEMAINVKVTCNPSSIIDEIFTLDFRVEDDGLTYGKVVKLGLQEILFHKITYKKTIREAVINSLLYTLVQKHVA
jgi:hypothetical protein